MRIGTQRSQRDRMGFERRGRWTLISHGDLAPLILSRLPVKSVLRFRSVCRRWLELTSEPSFLLSHTLSNPRPPIAGLILPSLQPNSFQVHRLPGRRHHPGPAPSFLGRLSAAIKFSCYPFVDPDSCHGLILFHGLVRDCDRRNHFYVCNPTTNHCRQITDPPTMTLCAVALFFDPSSPVCRHPSLHYRLLCIGRNRLEYKMLVYTSLSGFWRCSRNPLPSDFPKCFPIFTSKSSCGGAVHWSANQRLLVSFQMETEEVFITPFPTVSEIEGTKRYTKDICSFRDCLHLAEICASSATLLNIFQLNKDYSGWIPLYHINNLSVTTFGEVWFLGPVDEEESQGKGIQDLLFLAKKNDNRGSKLISYNLERSCYNKVNYLPGSTPTPFKSRSRVVFYAHSLYSP